MNHTEFIGWYANDSRYEDEWRGQKNIKNHLQRIGDLFVRSANELRARTRRNEAVERESSFNNNAAVSGGSRVTDTVGGTQPELSPETSISSKDLPNSGMIECCVCMDEPRSVLLLPCRHVAVCRACLTRLSPCLCPICRSPVQESIDIVVS